MNQLLRSQSAAGQVVKPLSVLGLAMVLGMGQAHAAEATNSPASHPPCKQEYTVKYQVFPGSLLNIVPSVAAARGIFKDNCVRGVAVPVNSAPAAFAQSVQGSVNMVLTAPDNVIRARANGLDVVIFANMFSRNIYSFVVSSKYKDLAGKPFKDIMNALRGKKIGVTVLGGSNEYFARSNFDAADMDPGSATYVALGTSANFLAALSQGTVDAVQAFGNTQDIAVAMGLGFIANDTRIPPSATNPVPEAGLRLKATTGWAAQAKYMDENKAAVKAFAKANSEAIEWISNKANRPQLYQILQKEVPMPEDIPNRDVVLKKSIDIFADQVSDSLRPEDIGEWLKFAEKFYKLEKTVELDKLVRKID